LFIVARGRLPGNDPLLPHRVERGKVGHVRQENRRGQQARLVAAHLSQEAVDRGQHLSGLRGHVGVLVVGHLAREIHDALAAGREDDGFGQTLANVAAFNGHGEDPGELG
jgi:hypothetical protein